MKFAKVFDLPGNMQVLVYTAIDDDDEDKETLHQMCRMNSRVIDIVDLAVSGGPFVIGKMFDAYNQDAAQKMFDSHIAPIIERFDREA